MQYRRLSERELEQFLAERAAYEAWRAYMAFATDVYGPNAARVAAIASWMYNDETNFEGIETITVFDAAGQELAPDLTTDWWQGELSEQNIDLGQRYRYDPVEMAIHERLRTLPVPAVGHLVYARDQPPKRTHTAVFVPVDAAVGEAR